MKKTVALMLLVGLVLMIIVGIILNVAISVRVKEEKMIDKINKLEEKNKQLKTDYNIQKEEAEYWYSYNGGKNDSSRSK